MNYSRLLISTSILTPGLVWTVFDARAQTCTQAPSCSELGYTKSASDCTGKTVLYCPFDRTKAYCNDETSCASLGFTDTISECPGEYTRCPSDSTKGKCDFEASPGDLKYSLRTSDHNGWLLCNGRSYSSSQYPELYAAISGSFGSKLPNYSGYFLKGAATSYASTFKTSEQAGLPNITGSFSDIQSQGTSTKYAYGAFSITQVSTGNQKGGSPSYNLSFDASKSNSIYGRSTTVTPQNYSANVFIYAGRNKNVDAATTCKSMGYTQTSGSCPTNSTKSVCSNSSTYFKCTCNSGYTMINNSCQKTYASCAAAGYINSSENEASCSSGITIYLTNGTSTTCYASSCASSGDSSDTCDSNCYQNCMAENNYNDAESQTCAYDCDHGMCH